MKKILYKQTLERVKELSQKYDYVIPYFVQDKDDNWYSLIFCNFDVKMYEVDTSKKDIKLAGYLYKKPNVNYPDFEEEILTNQEVEISIIELFHKKVGLGKKMMQFYEKCCDYLNVKFINLETTDSNMDFYKKLNYYAPDRKLKNRLHKQVEEYFSDKEIGDIMCAEHKKCKF